jgi:hypothetical protein
MSRIFVILLLLVAVTHSGATTKKHPDYVPDEKTAIRIAEAVLIARDGEERVKEQLPLSASISYGELWIVQGTEPGPPRKGGGIAVMINKHSGCIVNVMEHMK